MLSGTVCKSIGRVVVSVDYLVITGEMGEFWGRFFVSETGVFWGHVVMDMYVESVAMVCRRVYF